jgi:hypothetical protein
VTDLEDRLRRDLRQAASRVDPASVRPLRGPRRRMVPGAVRWLAPVTAMAAVIGVIVGVHLTASLPAKPPAATASGMPPYYVTTDALRHGTQPNSPVTRTATVRDSVTGAPLSTVQLPVPPDPGAADIDITGAADDLTYLIDDGGEYLLLHVAADGRSAYFSRPSITLPANTDDVFLSPDGDMVAFSTVSSCSTDLGLHPVTEGICRYSEIGIISLATGATRVWTTRAAMAGGFRFSWVSDDQILLTWSSATSSVPSGDYLLNVAGSGGDLLAGEHLPVPAPPVYMGVSYAQPAFLTPDQSTVITSAFVWAGSELTREIVEFSARSGGLIRVPYAESVKVPSGGVSLFVSLSFLPNLCTVQSLAATGVNALIACSPDLGGQSWVFGRVDDGTFTPLPAGNGGIAW